MSHYTLRSGQDTTTVSVSCPQCHTRRILTPDDQRRWVAEYLWLCSPACQAAWYPTAHLHLQYIEALHRAAQHERAARLAGFISEYLA
jgi:hypothetical protein